jgi:hypothetical protein
LARVLGVLAARLNPGSKLAETVAATATASPSSSSSLLPLLERILAMGGPLARNLLKDTELIRLFVGYAFAHLQAFQRGVFID